MQNDVILSTLDRPRAVAYKTVQLRTSGQFGLSAPKQYTTSSKFPVPKVPKQYVFTPAVVLNYKEIQLLTVLPLYRPHHQSPNTSIYTLPTTKFKMADQGEKEFSIQVSRIIHNRFGQLC